jgi:adenylylsulfate kinase
MLEAAGWLLRRDPARIVILDGRTFSHRYQIDRVLEVAAELHQSWVILECVCAQATARSRIELQAHAGEHVAGNRGFDLYLDVKARFEPILHPRTLIDTDRPMEECLNHALNVLR